MSETTAKPRSYFTAIERLEAWRSRASTSRHWSRGEEVDQLTQIIDELETEAETLADQRAELLKVLSQIISDLPTRRDWLDPNLEARAKYAIDSAKAVPK